MTKERVDFINIRNIIWSRKNCGLEFSDVYKRTGWSPKSGKIEKWEQGIDFPTISELKKLGKVYKKAWTLFLVQKDINVLGFTPLRDFRGSLGEVDNDLKLEMQNFLSELERRQMFLLEFAEEIGIKEHRIFGSLQGYGDMQIANRILEYLKIDMEVFREKPTRKKAINFLIGKLGEQNIYVSTSSTHHKKQIPVDIMRGVILRSSKVPIIGINSAEKSDGARIFTIFHELAHLFVEKMDDDVLIDKINFRDMNTRDKRESVCNRIAALILIPDVYVNELRGCKVTNELITQYSLKLKVNRDTLIYRLLNSSVITEESVSYLNNTYIRNDGKVSEKSPGGPDGGLMQVIRNGYAFAETVNSLYKDGVISYSQALGVLEVKSTTFNKWVNI